MRLPPEIIQLIIESIIPPDPPVAYPDFSGEIDTLVNLTLVSRFTCQIARRLLINHCLLIDDEWLLGHLLECEPPELVNRRPNDTGAQVQKSTAAGLVLVLEEPDRLPVARDIETLSFHLCHRLTRLVIDLPLRFYNPSVPELEVRPMLREAFKRLTLLEEFCSAADDLCLDTQKLPYIWETPSDQLEEADYEPAVWSLWPRLRRLALCEVDVTSMQFIGGLRRCSNLTHLVLVAPSGLDRDVRSGWQSTDFLPSLERLLIADSADEFEMVNGKDHLGDDKGFVRQLFHCYKSRESGKQRSNSKDEESVEFDSLVKKIAFPVPNYRKGDDDIICHGWLLDASIDGTIWTEPYGNQTMVAEARCGQSASGLRGNAAGVSNPSAHLHLHFRLTNPHWLGNLRDSSTLLIADSGGASPSEPFSAPLLDFSRSFFSSQEINGPDPAGVDDSRSKLSCKRPSNTPTPHGSGHFCLVLVGYNYAGLYRQPSHGRTTHSSQKPFRCGFCGSHYKRGDVLRRHWKSCSARIHAGQAIPGPRIGGKERHACDVCARLKKSCDGGQPCLECATRRKECTYLRLQDSGGAPRNQHTPSPTFIQSQPEPINSIPDLALPTWDLGLQPYYPNLQTRLKARARRDGVQTEG
ncbi:Zn(II)2Cys6 transcription factor domain-containing protein [Aspergillus tubingensis]|uniref:Zn(II)2Cys6 transcription factor domain-containing protein n=1 Tax=Aspergillus tubingensis TaxID=5068 RepID=UPI00157792D1|nr:MFS general substrate transporter [Aspergillus tubingensis]GFN12992.1 MFS general substrate transporter [Aspergillus tubingensis]